MGSRVYRSLEEALSAPRTVVSSPRCTCSFGTCSRAVPSPDNHDLYEPNEPALRKAGLPWFYFIANANSLVEDLREEYVSESAALWGSDHEQ